MLDPEDKKRQKFFCDRQTTLNCKAQRLGQQLPKSGEVKQVFREFKDGAIALSLLHSLGQLHWRDPCYYSIRSGKIAKTSASSGNLTIEPYLHTTDCRWQYLMRAFGFEKEAKALRCGKCDRCRVSYQ